MANIPCAWKAVTDDTPAWAPVTHVGIKIQAQKPGFCFNNYQQVPQKRE